MLRTRTDLWGAAFISTLGLSAFACSSSEDASDKDIAASNGNEADDDDAQQDDDVGESSDDDDSAEAPGPENMTDDDVQVPVTPAQPPTPMVPVSTIAPGPTSGGGTGGATQVPPGSAGSPGVGPAGGSSGGPSTLPAGGSGPGPTTPVSQCANSTPLLHGTVESGLETCANGVVHRPAAVECPNNLEGRTQPTGFVPTLTDGGVAPGACQVDADCTDQPFGHCDPQGQTQAMSCVYGCTEDADCGAGQICICGPDIGYCKAATCATDDDCEGDAMCAEWFDLFGFGCGEPPQYACQTPNDQCATAQDCNDQQAGSNCAVVDGARTCVETPGVACGRPFLVHGEAVLADAVMGPALPGHLLPAGPALSSDERAKLCSNWTEIGLMEHASIAAFARFCLQLMQLGAPSELLAAAQAAMSDETAHAQLAFDLASRYAGREISAGPLPLNHVNMNENAEDILRLVIREGCLGETVAALEAVEARAHCTVTDVSRVLDRIANDEQNHAALAWRFVSWITTQSPALRDVARNEFAHIAREAERNAATQPHEDSVDLSAHGALPHSLRAELRVAAIRDVVLPCAKRLLRVHTTSEVAALRA